ncbi:elongation of very long chain fatty acids protein 6 [Tetranychus urticae]|uniref:Elongation of very long chain fatty acids protein n=1 Tax=Tetranychus urticae TaxID=32264 RepID=T1JSC3_TETUR|nr:elongation of very long chain fatty acids protein 6 [Tetranychus urticae]XP_015791971.1 elongation of very long chain fatty acids protein 6 [Tetranychus urticae]
MDSPIITSDPYLYRSNAVSPNYTFAFPFEKSFVYTDARDWMRGHWQTAFYWIALYLVMVFGGQAYMSNRQPFKLRPLLILWNTSLAIFSILGTIRMMPEMIHILRNFGFYHSVCNPSYIEVSRVAGFWTWAFALSKVPELCDTLFIVFRKQNLIFLHWYHHITVLLFTWYCYAEHISQARWYICMNYVVHSFMYSYYALRASGFRVPKPIAMCITSSQILQMIMGFYVTYYAYDKTAQGYPCTATPGSIKWGLLMYASYFVLFANFFINSYYRKNKGVSQRGMSDASFVNFVNQKTLTKTD